MSWLQKDKVLVPFDFSEFSIGAIETALQLVSDASHVHVIHVLPVLGATELGVVWESVSDESRQEHVQKVLDEQFSEEKYRGIHFAVAFGDPGTEIAESAKKLGVELIVLPSHGRTGLKHLLLGSVAERVIRLAPCPVLVLKS
ncbi:MAG: universal stress protein [Planctomycetales bacterium]|nr:universal stress protein [Planctomycetales bacterium]NIM08381.1 universal stress protein [Planctomycetales bacterium]NIN07856.1 universal stress protein [Planctomycetales bacterium]NIN76985.1 universal stress protein [Planctomycetales bacterium]NIO34168.1 universal stress protein [Planctomycetales bacterium]